LSLEAAADLPAPESSAPEVQILRDESRVVVGKLLSSIRSRERRLMELVFLEERPNYRTISTTLQVPVGSIGPTRSRILKSFGPKPGTGNSGHNTGALPRIVAWDVVDCWARVVLPSPRVTGHASAIDAFTR
jgi:hypothetical protein